MIEQAEVVVDAKRKPIKELFITLTSRDGRDWRAQVTPDCDAEGVPYIRSLQESDDPIGLLRETWAKNNNYEGACFPDEKYIKIIKVDLDIPND